MPTPFDYDDEDDDFGADEGRGDSDLVKNLRKQLKEQQKLLRERDERLSSLEGAVRERTVSEVLQAKGVNPKVAKLMPRDLEASPEAIEQWISDYADVFNIARDEPPVAEEAAQPDSMAAYDRMRAVEGNGQAATGDQALQQKIANAGNEAELMAILRGAR